MACDAGESCIDLHVFPRLNAPKRAPGGYRALAPCHNDTAQSLSVTWDARNQRIIWNCFSCKQRFGDDVAQVVTRNALIRAGVSARCLPQPKNDAEAQLQAVREILGSKGKPAVRLLRIAAVLDGWDQLPRGDDLEALAESCLVSERTAYEARRHRLDR